MTVTSEGSCLEDETEEWFYASDGSEAAVRKARMYLQSRKPVGWTST